MVQLNTINSEKLLLVHLVDELDLALVADCLDGGLLPTVFTAATSRLCSRRPLADLFTAATSRLCSR